MKKLLLFIAGLLIISYAAFLLAQKPDGKVTFYIVNDTHAGPKQKDIAIEMLDTIESEDIDAILVEQPDNLEFDNSRFERLSRLEKKKALIAVQQYFKKEIAKEYDPSKPYFSAVDYLFITLPLQDHNLPFYGIDSPELRAKHLPLVEKFYIGKSKSLEGRSEFEELISKRDNYMADAAEKIIKKYAYKNVILLCGGAHTSEDIDNFVGIDGLLKNKGFRVIFIYPERLEVGTSLTPVAKSLLEEESSKIVGEIESLTGKEPEDAPIETDLTLDGTDSPLPKMDEYEATVNSEYEKKLKKGDILRDDIWVRLEREFYVGTIDPATNRVIYKKLKARMSIVVNSKEEAKFYENSFHDAIKVVDGYFAPLFYGLRPNDLWARVWELIYKNMRFGSKFTELGYDIKSAKSES